MGRDPTSSAGAGLRPVGSGCLFELDGDSSSGDGSSNSSFGFRIAPKLDIQLDSASRFKPFFGGALGIAFGSSDFSSDGADSSSTTATISSLSTALEDDFDVSSHFIGLDIGLSAWPDLSRRESPPSHGVMQ